MTKILVIILALYQSVHCLAVLPANHQTANIANQSLEFVKLIKDDLRRDNEDYEETEDEGDALLEKEAPPRINVKDVPPPLPPRPPNRSTIAPVQPPNQGLPSQNAPLRSSGQPPKIPFRRGFNLTYYITPKSDIDFNSSKVRSYTHSKLYKKIHAEKIKRLIEREKKIRNNESYHQTSKITVETTTVPTKPVTKTLPPKTTTTPKTPIAPLTRNHHAKRSHKHTIYSLKKSHAALRTVATYVRPVTEYQPIEAETPSPDQLDMAPARGRHVAVMRYKGRLCQRSMLNPEGPMYNKDGRTVIPFHDPKLVGRPFENTKPPPIVLPRCCNCCKKSVLGCE